MNLQKRVYAFDLDGTLCTQTSGDYRSASPHFERIRHVRRLAKAGNTIIIFTARGATSGTDYWQLTVEQLEAWEVPYDQLLMSKPHFDILVDDKATNSEIYNWAYDE